MAEEQVVETAEAAPPIPEDSNAGISAEEAVAYLARMEQQEQPASAPEPAPESPPPVEQQEEEKESEETEVSDDTAPVTEPPSSDTDEEQEVGPEDEDDLLPIDPPASLNKVDRDRFRSLPREAQQAWAEMEEGRSREIRRLQNEAAEKRRALDTELQAAQEAKAQYESALPQVLGMLNNELTSKFADIRTWDDVQRMRARNPNRYLEWDALTKQQQAVAADQQAAEQRKQQELTSNFSRYVSEQDAKFIESHPDWGDPDRAPALQKRALETLEDFGYSKEEIADTWTRGYPLSARDARFQSLVAELVDLRGKYQKAKTALERSKVAKAPPVTRPGVASTKQEANAAHLDELRQQAAKTGSVEDAVRYLSEIGG